MKRSSHTSAPRLPIFFLLLCLLLTGVLTVSAQAMPTPINIGENKTGEVADPNSPVEFSISVATPQSVSIQVLAITSGFAPTFNVLDPSGIVILDTANSGTQTIAQGSPSLSSPGSYTIVVKAATSTPGQFLISLQPGAPLAPPTPLPPGQPLTGTVDGQHSREAYSFSSSPTDVLALMVRSTTPDSGLLVRISDADSGELLGMNSTKLLGADFRIPVAAKNYLVEVTYSGSNTTESFNICLGTESGSIPCPGTGIGLITPQPTEVSNLPTPTVSPQVQTQEASDATATFSPIQIDPNGACQVASAHGQSINVRSGPGTNFNVLTQLAPNATGLVIGRLADNSWYQVNVGGVPGWVSASVVIIGGNCAGVSVVTLSPPAFPTATSLLDDSLTATQMSLDATATAQDQNLATAIALTATARGPGGGGVDFPPGPAFATLPVVGGVQFHPKLEYTGIVHFDRPNLSYGFSPDPYIVNPVVAVGYEDVSYLGGSCTGFVWDSIPDVHVNFAGGGSPLLRFYYIGSNGDSIMVVSDPNGNYYCSNDSFGTPNPTIDFNNPAGGSYDVWIGAYAANMVIGGNLYITENSGNHP